MRHCRCSCAALFVAATPLAFAACAETATPTPPRTPSLPPSAGRRTAGRTGIPLASWSKCSRSHVLLPGGWDGLG